VGWLYLLEYGLDVWDINKDAAMPNTVRAIDPISYRDMYYFCVRSQILDAEGKYDFTKPDRTKQNCVTVY